MLFGRLNKTIQTTGKLTIREGDDIIEAGTFDSMLSNVKAYRFRNGGDLAPGWEHRLGTLVVEQNPIATVGCSVEPEFANYRYKITGGDVMNFLGTMTNFLKDGGKFVDVDEAERRASICASCPHNGSMAACSTCLDVGRRVATLIKGQQTSHHDDLKTCNRCGCMLKAKVWFPLKSLRNSKSLPLPDECWQKGHVDELLR